MPQINWDPFAGVKSVNQAGENISAVLEEAHKAESAMLEQRKMREGAKFLHEVINHRAQEVGKENPEAGKALEFAPFLDPVVQKAAMAVSPVAKDYVSILQSISDKNADRLKPIPHDDGIYKFNPMKMQYENIPNPTKLYHAMKVQPDKEGKPRDTLILSDPDTGETIKTVDKGPHYTAATTGNDPTTNREIVKRKGKLAGVQRNIAEFEANPNLMNKMDEILKDPDYKRAVAAADVDLAGAIMSKFLGETTGEKVLTKRMLDYMRAKDVEADELGALEEYGVDVGPLKRKPPTKKKAGGF